MKSNFVLLVFLSVSILFTSCIREGINPSSNVTSVAHNVSGFSGIEVSSAFEVFVTFSDTEESVIIEANDNLQDEIIVQKVNNQLVIRLKNGINIRGNSTLNAIISTTDATAFDGSGATNFIFKNQLNADRVHIDLSGASTLSGNLVVDELNIDLSGASEVEVSGNSEDLTIEASGASNLEDYDFVTNDLNADLSGASNLEVTVNGQLNVEASGASGVYFKGDGQTNKLDLSGGGFVTNRN